MKIRPALGSFSWGVILGICVLVFVALWAAPQRIVQEAKSLPANTDVLRLAAPDCPSGWSDDSTKAPFRAHRLEPEQPAAPESR